MMQVQFMHRHSGASRSDEPGIHNPGVSFSTKTLAQGVWIPGLRQTAHPGMTKSK
jgi:hypothetical protein